MTIFALSSGPGMSGVAVIRVSGKNTAYVVKKLTGSKLPSPRVATLKKFNKNGGKELIDEGVIIWFPAPNSYTGEDLAEFHVHGSRAVVKAMHSTISKIKKSDHSKAIQTKSCPKNNPLTNQINCENHDGDLLGQQCNNPCCSDYHRRDPSLPPNPFWQCF